MTPKTPPGKFKGGPTADKGRAAIKSALENHDGPMTPFELGEALKSSGFDYVDSSGMASLYMRGWSEVERIGHGLYCLAGQHQEPEPPEDRATPESSTRFLGTLSDFIITEMRKNDRPMRLKELINLAQQNGFKSNSLSSSISGAINNNTWGVAVGRGLYMLSSDGARKLKADKETRPDKVNRKKRLQQVRNVLRKAFKDHDAPMRLTEMTAALRDSGYKSNNFMGCVSDAIRKSNEFERIGYGVYRYKSVDFDDDQPKAAPYTAPYSEITGFILGQMEKHGRPLSRPEIRHLAILHGYEAGDKLDWSIASAIKGSRFKKVKFLGYAPADKTGRS